MKYTWKRLALALLSCFLLLALASCIGDDKQEPASAEITDTGSAEETVTSAEDAATVATDPPATADGSPIELPVVP